MFATLNQPSMSEYPKIEALAIQLQGLDISDLPGLNGLHEALVELDRLLYRILINQPEPTVTGCWGYSRPNSKQQRDREGRLKVLLPTIHGLVQRRKELWAMYNERARPHLRPLQLLI
ncbi:hypothetical protein CPLU01_10570 [Colletotrichum plurivorum]|uniref:Uncharacterized protein n=1 Tax=Colletotrichum plurivorum TaxID=2175906 RepID=A0A8H6K5Q0_9PEZI|nr:hypothetical protein CPLU01_10570 [Colletotrichum plurivorum]